MLDTKKYKPILIVGSKIFFLSSNKLINYMLSNSYCDTKFLDSLEVFFFWFSLKFYIDFRIISF